MAIDLTSTFQDVINRANTVAKIAKRADEIYQQMHKAVEGLQSFRFDLRAPSIKSLKAEVVLFKTSQFSNNKCFYIIVTADELSDGYNTVPFDADLSDEMVDKMGRCVMDALETSRYFDADLEVIKARYNSAPSHDAS